MKTFSTRKGAEEEFEMTAIIPKRAVTVAIAAPVPSGLFTAAPAAASPTPGRSLARMKVTRRLRARSLWTCILLGVIATVGLAGPGNADARVALSRAAAIRATTQLAKMDAAATAGPQTYKGMCATVRRSPVAWDCREAVWSHPMLGEDGQYWQWACRQDGVLQYHYTVGTALIFYAQKWECKTFVGVGQEQEPAAPSGSTHREYQYKWVWHGPLSQWPTVVF